MASEQLRPYRPAVTAEKRCVNWRLTRHNPLSTTDDPHASTTPSQEFPGGDKKRTKVVSAGAGHTSIHGHGRYPAPNRQNGAGNHRHDGRAVPASCKPSISNPPASTNPHRALWRRRRRRELLARRVTSNIHFGFASTWGRAGMKKDSQPFAERSGRKSSGQAGKTGQVSAYFPNVDKRHRQDSRACTWAGRTRPWLPSLKAG